MEPLKTIKKLKQFYNEVPCRKACLQTKKNKTGENGNPPPLNNSFDLIFTHYDLLARPENRPGDKTNYIISIRFTTRA